MKHRLTIPVMIAAMALGAAACGGNPEPQGPTPEEIAQARADSIARANQARQDSIDAARRAEQQRLEAERQAALRETEAARAILQEMIHFGYDESAILPAAEQTLMRKVTVLRANPNVRLRIAGHTDERGSIEYNMALGQRRAQSARDFIVGFGVDASRIEIVSFGEDRPLVNASNESAWERNRRAEFTVIAGGDALRNPGGN